MERSRRFLLLLSCMACAALIPAHLSAQVRQIRPNVRYAVEMELHEDFTDYLSYSIDVPEDVTAMKISIFNSPADLDIFINYEESVDNYDTAQIFGISEDFNEEIFFTRFSDFSLQPGTYYFDIAYQRKNLPERNGTLLTSLPFSFEVELRGEQVETELIPGRSYRSVLYPEQGMFTTFTLRVPPGVQALRFDITDSVADVDILARHEDYVKGYDSADYAAESLLSRETLLITRDSPKPLQSGTYYITVLDQIAAEYPVGFTIVPSLEAAVPESLAVIEALPIPGTPLERVLFSTVEVIGESGKGSGCIVSSDGYIVTNFHVVRGNSGDSERFLTVAVTTDPQLPPDELFRAEVVDTDREKDLALLKITSGMYGQSLPEEYPFPYIPIRPENDYAIGDIIHCAGYPGIGGTGSRASITFTRGVISGFERTSYGTILKTDGLINSGSSGGAAVDERFQLIGLPAIIMEEESGQLGFILPVSLLPEDWRERIN